MACLSRPSIFFLAMIVQALAHWVQELDLYADGSGATWKGCVLKSCKSPKKHQPRCQEEEGHQSLYGSDFSHDSAHASGLHHKATAIAAYMRTQDQSYRQDLKAIWANNGKGLLIGYPGGRPEKILPEKADYYKLKEALFQVENAACMAGKRLGEIRLSVTRQEIIKTDGSTDDCKDSGQTCGIGSIAVLKVKIDNLCHDCGSQVDKGFYLRVTHWTSKKKDEFKFEFTGRKALACDSTGTFDVILSSLDSKSAVKKEKLWPENVKIEVVSPCREAVAHMEMTKADTAEKLVASSWLGMFAR